jgi:hypothetical protein
MGLHVLQVHTSPGTTRPPGTGQSCTPGSNSDRTSHSPRLFERPDESHQGDDTHSLSLLSHPTHPSPPTVDVFTCTSLYISMPHGDFLPSSYTPLRSITLELSLLDYDLGQPLHYSTAFPASSDSRHCPHETMEGLQVEPHEPDKLLHESQGAAQEEQGERFDESQAATQEDQEGLSDEAQGATQVLEEVMRASIEVSSDSISNGIEVNDMDVGVEEEQVDTNVETSLDIDILSTEFLEAGEAMEDVQDDSQLQGDLELSQVGPHEQEQAIEGAMEDMKELGEDFGDVQAKPHEHDEIMESVQDEAQEQVQVMEDAQAQPEYDLAFDDLTNLLGEPEQITVEQPQEELSLFVPEERVHTPPPRQQATSMMPPPTTPTSRSTARPQSTFAKIRNLQQKLKQSKVAASNPSYPYQSMPDHEAYLEAAQSIGAGRYVSEQPESTDDYDLEDKKASAEYQKEKRKYDQLKLRNGKLNFREEIEWMRTQSAEKSRRAKRKRDQQRAQEDDGEPDLFPDFQSPRGSGEDHESDDEDAVDFDLASISSKQRLAMPRKPERQISMQEAELHAMRVALDAEPDLPKKKRKVSKDSQEQSSAVSSAKPRSRKLKGMQSLQTLHHVMEVTPLLIEGDEYSLPHV